MSWNWIASRMNKFTVGYWLWFTNFFAIFAIYEAHVRHTPTIRLVLGICSLTAFDFASFSQSWPLVQLRWMVPLTIFFKKKYHHSPYKKLTKQPTPSPPSQRHILTVWPKDAWPPKPSPSSWGWPWAARRHPKPPSWPGALGRCGATVLEVPGRRQA